MTGLAALEAAATTAETFALLEGERVEAEGVYLHRSVTRVRWSNGKWAGDGCGRLGIERKA